MSVDALQIWEKLADECGEAVKYYSGACGKEKEILERGAADFDRKYKPDDEHEKPYFRTDYYVSKCGYMDMHVKQNLQSFRHCFKDEISQPLLFVDFGCGPMTSGIALADFLSKQKPNYKTQTAYFGIDVSRNMVNKANSINQKYKLFMPEYFKVVQDSKFNSNEIPYTFPAPQMVVLSLSFVLAPDTLKPKDKEIVGELANDWKRYIENQRGCGETRIIYLNPFTCSLNGNWDALKNTMLAPNIAGKFCYTNTGHSKLHVDSLGKNVYYDMIRGIRK